MEDRYRLVFHGEVLEGQHRAVVKKRLGALLKVDGDRLDALMSGEPVVVRREADKPTAAKFQSAFKQAGARLRIQPLTPSAATETPRVPDPAETSAAVGAGSAVEGLTLRPKAGELLDASERRAPPRVVVDTSHLSVAPVGPLPETARVEALVTPDISHLTLAEAGAALSEPTDVSPAIDVDGIDFDVAPAGTDLGQTPAPPAPPPPDTSKLSLE